MIRRSGFLVRAVEVEELFAERVSAAKRHGCSHHREVEWGEFGCLVEVGVSNIAQTGSAGVCGEPEVESGFHFVASQIGDGMARIFGNLAVTNPGSYEFEMVLAVDAGQLGENVGTELGRVGPDDPVLFVHPDDGWHVADCVQLGEVVVGVDEDRVGNLFGELLEGVNIFVDSYRNNREPCVT